MSFPRPYDQTSSRFREDLRKHGCVVFAGLSALDHAGYDHSRSDVDDEAWSLFKRSGESLAGFRKDGLSLDQLATAIKATPSGNRVPWRIQRHRGIKVATTLRDLLREHRDAVAVVNVRRGVIVKAGRATGYRGDHGIVIAYHSDDKAQVADSLIVEPRLWEWDLLADAMDSFGDKPWGGGRGEALVMWPSPTWSSEVSRYRDLMRKARDQRDTARARVRELEAHPPMTDPQCAARLAHATERIERAMAVLGGTDGTGGME